MRLAPCNIGLCHFFAINLLYCDCGSVEAQLPHERRIPGTIPGICQDYILLLWVFREPIVALSIKKAHRPSLPVAAINIGTLVPILLAVTAQRSCCWTALAVSLSPALRLSPYAACACVQRRRAKFNAL